MPRVKTLSKEEGDKLGLSEFPNFHKSGSIIGMKRKYYGSAALLVRHRAWIYNVSSKPEIYHEHAH